MLKNSIKKLIKSIPISFTQNQKYDKQTRQIINRVCKDDTNCIDVGCHKGEVMDMILQASPNGKHYAFEPIPVMFEALKVKYKEKAIEIFDIALSNEDGTSTFNYVTSNPSYSGLIKRSYDKLGEKDKTISVSVRSLDDIIGSEEKIGLLKIDVEGGEGGVLLGAKNLLKSQHPIVIFEHGLGASNHYNTGPEDIYKIFIECDMKISTMKTWLDNGEALSLEEFKKQYYEKLNFNFVGYK